MLDMIYKLQYIYSFAIAVAVEDRNSRQLFLLTLQVLAAREAVRPESLS